MALTVEQRTFLEGASGVYTATLKDQDGTAIPAAQISTLTLTLYNKEDGSIINSRNAQNVLNANGVTVHVTSGLLTWVIDGLDSPIVGVVPFGEYEEHIALFEGTTVSGADIVHEISLLVRSVRYVGSS